MEVPIPLLGLPLAEVPQGKLLDKDDILRLLYGKFGGTLATFKVFGKITCAMRRGSKEARCSTPGGCTVHTRRTMLSLKGTFLNFSCLFHQYILRFSNPG